MNEKQLKEVHELRTALFQVSRMLNETAERFDVFVLNLEREVTPPDVKAPPGWQMPAKEDWQAPTGRFGCWVEPTKEPWQIGDHEFDELEAVE